MLRGRTRRVLAAGAARFLRTEAITDADWNLYVDFTPAVPGCGADPDAGVYVPTAGLIHNAQFLVIMEC